MLLRPCLPPFIFLLFIFDLSAQSDLHYRFEPNPQNPFGKRDPATPMASGDFDPLIGEQACLSLTRIDRDNWADTTTMLWRWKYIMNGNAVQDETLLPNGRNAGSIRQYIADSANWYVHFYSSTLPSTALPAWEGNLTDTGDIVLYRPQTAPNGMEGFYKIVFSEIDPWGFDWLGAWVTPDEKIVYQTWKIWCDKIPYVGFQRMEITRKSAQFNKSGDKTIPVSLWYPSTVDHEDQKEERTRYHDYAVELSSPENDQEIPEMFFRMVNSYDSIPGPTKAEKFLKKAAFSVPDANPRDGKYPLVLIGGGRPLNHLELAEVLAHRGYVAASFPRLGIKEGERLSFTEEGASEYMEDLAFVLEELKELPNVDPERVYLLCWSYEGAPALAYASTASGIKGFFSLDASLGYEYGPGLVEKSLNPKKIKFNFPVFHFTSETMDHGKDLSFLGDLKTAGNQIEIQRNWDLSHAGFTSIGSVTAKRIKEQEEDKVYMDLIAEILGQLNRLEAKEHPR